ncbi:MAG: ABC transporter ATP-binding protein [Bacteroidetes bacterium]|nr:ABC transporter ATP-binding protein [Bacteroidota bacterium]
MKLLEVEQLNKSFKDFQAVKNLSFSVNQGDIYGFLGPNGAGKSTTLRMILGLIYPSGGSIRFKGELITPASRNYLSHIGALIERPDFYTNLTAYQNLSIFAKLSAIQNRENRIQEVLREVKLDDRQHSKVKSYSQGMKQRLGIAQAILHKPDLIILDEPSNGLDPQGQADMRELILRISREMNITVILSSHILSEIEQIANRMLIISRGEKLREGGVKELMAADEMNVDVKTDRPQEAAKMLLAAGYSAEMYNGYLRVRCDEAGIPEMTKTLLTAGFLIYEIKQLRTLEEYFIHVTA